MTHGARTLTYGELSERVAALSGAYRSLGIEPGERIVCQLPTSPEHLIAACAAWACGAIHVGVHKDLTGPELAAIAGRVDARAVVFAPPAGAPAGLAGLRALRADRPQTIAIVHGHPPQDGEHALAELLGGAIGAPATPPQPRTPAAAAADLLLLTSGTTGRPRAVVETLPALWAKVEFFAGALRPGPDDVHLMYLPVNHAFGLKLSLMALASGGRLVLLDSFSAAQALRLASDERVTILPATPTHLTLLLRELDPRSHRVDSLRWVVAAAAALPPAAIEGVYERFGAELLYVYGCSEGFLTQTTDRAEIRAGSAGRQVFRAPRPAIAPPDGSVAILDVEHDVELARGDTGEIAFGTSRAVRYWGEPAPAGAARWYRSGDLGRLDENGRLFVSGRLKEVVNRGGLKVACGEVEAALARHPAVADCAVVATPDPVLGEAICACIVVGDGGPPTLAGVRARLAERLARHKLPDELCVLDALPRSPLGKLDRPALTALVVDGDAVRTRQRPAIEEPVAAGGAQAQTNHHPFARRPGRADRSADWGQ